jgi:NAD(P)-dependent dehydrogenase (short-subunit alcohol dehydrogenase family)
VAVADRQNAQTFADEVNQSLGREVMIAFQGDVTDAAFRADVFRQMKRAHGAVHICIPAAGIVKDALAVRLSRDNGHAVIYPLDDFERVLSINLTAPIYWALEAIASVAEDRRRRGLGQWLPEEGVQGGIIFIGSISSAGNRGQISYATAKAGLEGAQATLATEAIYHGIRCAIIHPGFTDTPMVRALGEEFVQRNILPYTQLKRLIRPEEIADAICFMLRNSSVSGVLWADAGWHPAP